MSPCGARPWGLFSHLRSRSRTGVAVRAGHPPQGPPGGLGQLTRRCMPSAQPVSPRNLVAGPARPHPTAVCHPLRKQEPARLPTGGEGGLAHTRRPPTSDFLCLRSLSSTHQEHSGREAWGQMWQLHGHQSLAQRGQQPPRDTTGSCKSPQSPALMPAPGPVSCLCCSRTTAQCKPWGCVSLPWGHLCSLGLTPPLPKPQALHL